ncbi:MAG TPA: type II toxin-antitoxin system PemK/MazF family toxin [Sphingomicrobium sp.]|nr:type II toxin-antitoxin system PemK/MazF family toxin [Sphingomicrobium sp.]
MEIIIRGDILVAVQRGEMTGKPRPVLVIQNDIAAARHGAVTACLMTSDLTGAGLIRLPVVPTAGNGLQETTEVQIDQIHTFRRNRLAKRVGCLSPDDMVRVDEALRRWLSL